MCIHITRSSSYFILFSFIFFYKYVYINISHICFIATHNWPKKMLKCVAAVLGWVWQLCMGSDIQIKSTSCQLSAV